MDEDSGLQQELELLEAIYLEDLTVEHPDSANGVSCVRVQLYPATGDNVEEKYVCLTLEFNLNNRYPDEVPEMVIRNPRGLADDHVIKLRQSLRTMAAQRCGVPMLYELIELGKESLTDANVPQGQCVICLEVLEPGEMFTKTECYHYFHVGCLLRYVEHCHEQMEQEREEIRQHKHMTHEKKAIVCPVCREPIAVDIASLRAQAPVAEMQGETITMSPEIRALQRKMAALYAHQQAKGGIIDVEAERNKFLIPSESRCPEPFHAAPLHLFNQDQLPENLNAGYLSHSGKGRGRPLPGRGYERSVLERPDKHEVRNDYRKEHRHRERRDQGRDKSREEKPRSDSSGRHHDRNFKKGFADRDRRTGGWGGDASGGGHGAGGSGSTGSRPPRTNENAEVCRDGSQYNRVHREDSTISDDSHHNQSIPPRRLHRGGKQTSQWDEPRHVPEPHRENIRREEQNGYGLGECHLNESSRLNMSNGGRETRRKPQHYGLSHRRGGAVDREGRPFYECDLSDKQGQVDRPASRREGRRGSGRSRGRNYHDSYDGKPLGSGSETSQSEAHFRAGRNVENSYSFDEISSRGKERKSGASDLSYEPRGEPRNQDYKYGGRSQPPRYDRRKLTHDRQVHKDCDSVRNNHGHQGRPQPPPGLNECKPPPGFLHQMPDAHYRPHAPPAFDSGS